MSRRGPAAFSGDGASVSTARGSQLPSFAPRQPDYDDEVEEVEEEEEDEEEGDEEEEQEDEQDDLEAVEGHSYEEALDDADDDKDSSAPIPPNLREISSLASWSVSTYKPGSGVDALRNPSPNQFWQSDGPQPHTLVLHFFRRVAIVRIRVYLDFELDESYTPTKMVFLAGMGGNDLVEFATWQGETPCGWVDIKLDGVGGRHPARRESLPDCDRDDDGSDDCMDGQGHDEPGNVLKLMVLHVKVCENHQNGKDTHVRGFQVFARDDRYYSRTARADHPQKAVDDEHDRDALPRFDEDDWIMEPELR